MMQKLNSLRLNGNGRPNFRSTDLWMGMLPWSNRQIFVSLLFRFAIAETVLAAGRFVSERIFFRVPSVLRKREESRLLSD